MRIDLDLSLKAAAPKLARRNNNYTGRYGGVKGVSVSVREMEDVNAGLWRRMKDVVIGVVGGMA